MNTREALKAMLEGKKVRGVTWDTGEYVFISKDGYIIDNEHNLIGITNSSNWEIYEEPKPKQTVTIEKWLIRDCMTVETIIEINTEHLDFFLNESSSKKVKFLDAYEVEL